MTGDGNPLDVTEVRTPRRDRWLGVELRHLAALAAIAREGSFRGAADRLGYVQSAVSQQIAHLERIVGARLVERSRGITPVSLTEEGELLMQHVDVILARMRAAQTDIAALLDGRAGTLRVGAFQSVATRVLPHVLPVFVRSCPEVRIEPTETQTDAPLFDLLEAGEVDVAFCELPLADGPFDSVALIEDPFVLIVSSDSPLAQRTTPPSLAEIGRLRLVGYVRSRAQERVLEQLLARGIEPQLFLRSNFNSVVQALVGADIGAALVPLLTVDPKHPGTAVIGLADPPSRRIALVWHSERERSPAMVQFVEMAKRTCAVLTRRWAGAGEPVAAEVGERG